MATLFSSKLKTWGSNGMAGLTYWCPGCERPHSIRTSSGGWHWDGNVDKPTFSPQIRFDYPPAGNQPGVRCCCYVTRGLITYLPESTHKLSGQSVWMPDLPEHMRV